MEVSAIVADDEPSRRDRGFGLHRAGEADAVVVVCIVVRVRPPAFGDGRVVHLRILAVGQAQDIARSVMRAKARGAAVVAWDRVCHITVRKRQGERYVAAAGLRKPVHDLLTVPKLGEARDSRPRGGGGGLGTDDDLAADRPRAALHPCRTRPAFEHVRRDGGVQPKLVQHGRFRRGC